MATSQLRPSGSLGHQVIDVDLLDPVPRPPQTLGRRSTLTAAPAAGDAPIIDLTDEPDSPPRAAPTISLPPLRASSRNPQPHTEVPRSLPRADPPFLHAPQPAFPMTRSRAAALIDLPRTSPPDSAPIPLAESASTRARRAVWSRPPHFQSEFQQLHVPLPPHSPQSSSRPYQQQFHHHRLPQNQNQHQHQQQAGGHAGVIDLTGDTPPPPPPPRASGLQAPPEDEIVIIGGNRRPGNPMPFDGRLPQPLPPFLFPDHSIHRPMPNSSTRYAPSPTSDNWPTQAISSTLQEHAHRNIIEPLFDLFNRIRSVTVGVDADAPFRVEFPSGRVPAPAAVAAAQSRQGRRPAPAQEWGARTTRQGFTRDTNENQVVVCPNCLEELAYDPDGAAPVPGSSRVNKAGKKKSGEHHFWAVKACGHVYCAKCFHDRGTKKALRFRGGPGKILECAVDDCHSDVRPRGGWVGLYL